MSIVKKRTRSRFARAVRAFLAELSRASGDDPERRSGTDRRAAPPGPKIGRALAYRSPRAFGRRTDQ